MPPQDVPADLFFNQLGNTTVRAVLTGSGTLPANLTPSALLLSIADAVGKAQTVFNAENGTVPNVGTVSARELGPIVPTPDGKVQAQVFYTIGGEIVFDPGNAGPIIL